MSNEGNYIKLYRSFLDWEWYGDIHTKLLFLHMLLKANWKDARFQGTTVPRGSFLSSYQKLAEETGLAIREIRTAVTHLKTTGEVTCKATNKYSVFTVVNYDVYQTSDRQNDRQVTGGRQPNDNPTTTIEEGKKETREEGNTPPVSPVERFEDFWSAYPKQEGRYLAEQEYAALVCRDGVEERILVEAAWNYGDACKRLGKTGQYVKNPDNWLKEFSWRDYQPGGGYVPPKRGAGKAGF